MSEICRFVCGCSRNLEWLDSTHTQNETVTEKKQVFVMDINFNVVSDHLIEGCEAASVSSGEDDSRDVEKWNI